MTEADGPFLSNHTLKAMIFGIFIKFWAISLKFDISLIINELKLDSENHFAHM